MKRIVTIVVLMILSALYGVGPLFLPRPLPVTAPAGEFSALRALQHVAVIGKQVHPAGSPAMAQVAAYLSETLLKTGLQPEIQATQTSLAGSPVTLRNVVVRLPGTAPSGAVLFLAHPDSTPYGPGAGDNATGAAVLLEVARALQSSPPLQNDVILLFDDGEEYGYLGGYAFAREHPWMGDVRLAIGLDTAAWGPVVLLQTAPQNGLLIRGYAQAVRSPLAFGFLADVDWTLADDSSEILPFAEAGLPGMALEDPTAFVGKHTSSDTLAAVKPGSLQQMGDQVLALARQYGRMDLSQARSPDQSYFTLWGLGVVVYPAWLNAPLVALAVAGFAGLIALGIRRRAFGWKELLTGSLYSLGSVAMSALVGWGGAALFTAWFPRPHPYIDNYLLPASLPFFVLALALIAVLYALGQARVARRVRPAAQAVASLATWVALSLAFIGLLRVGSYLFVWPLILGLAAWGWGLAAGSAGARLLHQALLVIPAFAAMVLVTPNAVLAFLGTGVAILPVVALLVVSLLQLWAPLWQNLATERGEHR